MDPLVTLADLIFPALGSLLVAGAVVGFLLQRLRFASWHSAAGTVVGHRVRQTRRSGRSRTMHHPVVRFVVSGAAREYESPVSTSEPRRAEGSPVVVIYDPSDPDAACLDEFREKHFVPMLVAAIGAIFVIVGITFA